MKSILLILFSPTKGLIELDNEFEDDLFRKSIFIFGVYGFIFYLKENIVNDSENISFIYKLIELSIYIILNILIGLIISKILHKIGIMIGGKSEFIDYLSFVSHSVIPIILSIIIIGLLQSPKIVDLSINNYYIKMSVAVLLDILALNILLKGTMKFNDFRIKKAILNILPVIIFKVMIYSLILY